MDELPPLPNSVEWYGPDIGMVRGPDKQNVIFYNKSVPDPIKSREVGRPYNVNKTFIRMYHPGEERTNVIDRPAAGEDAKRFPVQWAQFQQNKEQTVAGTPIELLFPDSPAHSANLRACGVHTIEQCAELSGSGIDNIGMGAQERVNAAKRYLEAAQKGVHYTHMNQELSQRDGEIRVLKQQVESLRAELSRFVQEGQTVAPTAVTPAQLAQLLASVMQQPQFPAPGVTPTAAFDAQAVQINTTHPSHDTKPMNPGVFQALPQPPIHPEVQKRRGRPRKDSV